MKYRGKDDTIAGTATDRAADQARAVEAKFSIYRLDEWFQLVYTRNIG